MSVAVVLAAAGSGSRMGAPGNKVLLSLDGKPVLSHSLDCFSVMDEVCELVVVTREVDRQAVSELVHQAVPDKKTQVVLGGASRQDSVYLGLLALTTPAEWIVIHDGARPFITPGLVRKGLRAAQEHRAVGIAVPVKDTIKKVQDGFVLETPDRAELWAMQTPQIFARDLILQAYAWAQEEGLSVTDDCSVLEAFGHPVHIVPGEYANIKITTPDDLPQSTAFSVGFGYDVHALAANRPLILGGVLIPHDKGLLGHSDADVLTHALVDALLGAMGGGDIGELFPDTDPKYKGACSIDLLKQVLVIMEDRQFTLGNLDITVMAEKPKLKTWKTSIKSKLAQVLAIEESQINLKATTTEGLGFVGREEGIAAQAVVLLRSN